jgi:signal transduction histidine kinase
MAGVLRMGPRDSGTVSAGFFINQIVQDASGIIWTIDYGRIFRLQGRRFVPLSLRPGSASNLTGITVDREGSVWVYDEALGLLRLTADSLIRVASLSQPGFSHAYLFSDREGRIWVGQPNRVALYDHGQIRLFEALRGEGPAEVYGFFEDHSGSIWVASAGGVSKYEGGRFRTLPERQAVAGRSVYGIAEDAGGAWWMLTRAGVLRLPPGEVDRALADSGYRVRSRSFDQLDGLPGMVTAGDWAPQLTRAADGRIWVATDSGVASLDPRNLPRDSAPPVLIEALRVSGRDVAPSDAKAIPSSSRDLEIDYTAATLSIPERVGFRYRLEGEDSEWHEVGTRRRAYYTGLGPGSYTFRVTATNSDGVWNHAGAVWHFRVLPAWYQTFWFRSGLVFLIGGLGAAAAGLVQRRRHLRLQQVLTGRYEATLAERARIAQDLHDTLLQGIAGVSMQLKAAERALPDAPDVAAETLIQVQRLTRETLREARERVLDLNEPDLGHGDLAGALEASAAVMLGRSGIELSVVTQGERRRLPRTVEVTALRIGREAIANAVRHAEARRIEVIVAFDAAALRLEIRDDGHGFTPEQGELARRQGHLGLTGMRDRAARAGGTCEVRSGEEGGTVIAVELPLGEAG